MGDIHIERGEEKGEDENEKEGDEKEKTTQQEERMEKKKNDRSLMDRMRELEKKGRMSLKE